MTSSKIKLGVMACVTVITGLANHASAQDAATNYPSRTVTLVLPVGVGGPLDTVSRVVAAALSTQLGTSVVVENKPGAAGAIAAAAVARANPEG